MIGFFLKKNFFDGWDNFIPLVFLNGIVILVVFFFFTLASLFSVRPLLVGASLCVGGMVLCSLFLAISHCMSRIADYQSFSWKEFLTDMRSVWKHGCLFALLEVFCVTAVNAAIPYYLSFKNFPGLVLSICVFWMFAVIQLSLVWFFPIRSRLEEHFGKCLKKCFIFFLGNTGFTVFIFFYSIFLIVFTPFLAFLAPGISGLLLAWNNALKLRMYKYDWIEQQPEIPIRHTHIPWDDLLAEDSDIVGNRTLRTLIFPWKD